MREYFQSFMPTESELHEIKVFMDIDVASYDSLADHAMAALEWKLKEYETRYKSFNALVPAFERLMHAIGQTLLDRVAATVDNPYSFTEMMVGGEMQQFLTLLIHSGILRPTDIGNRATFFHTIWSYLRAGKQTYRVTDVLSDSLINTELRGLTSDDLQLPFKSLLVEVPESTDFKVWNEHSGWHRLRGIFILESDRAVDGEFDKGADLDTVVTSRAWRIFLVGEDKGGATVKGVKISNDATYFLTIDLSPGMSLDSCIEHAQKVFEREYRWNPAIGGALNSKRENWLPIFTWIMNLIIYVTNVEKGQEFIGNKGYENLHKKMKASKGKKKAKLKQQLKAVDPHRYILVGRKYMSESRSSGSGSKPYIRTKVAGHWRRVVCGKGRVDRRLTWIEPFWRGPKDAPVSNPVRVVT